MVRIKAEQRQEVFQQTRQALLQAAAGEFARLGYDQANINAISLAAGFAKGTVYNYFPSKQDLLLALIDSIAQEHLEFLRAAVLEAANPAGRLARFFQAGFDYVVQQPTRARVMLNTVNGSNQAQKEHCFQAYQPIFRLLAEEILQPGIQQGLFRPADPQETALLLMTLYLGAASQVDDQGRPWLDAGRVAQFALNGLR